MALAAAGADLGDDGEDDVLGGHVRRQFAFHVHGHRLERLERQGLCGEHVLDLRRADAERQGTERAMRGRMGITAHDGHARLCKTQLRAHLMHDALVGVAQRMQAHAELLAVLLEGAQLQR